MYFLLINLFNFIKYANKEIIAKQSNHAHERKSLGFVLLKFNLFVYDSLSPADSTIK